MILNFLNIRGKIDNHQCFFIKDFIIIIMPIQNQFIPLPNGEQNRSLNKQKQKKNKYISLLLVAAILFIFLTHQLYGRSDNDEQSGMRHMRVDGSEKQKELAQSMHTSFQLRSSPSQQLSKLIQQLEPFRTFNFGIKNPEKFNFDSSDDKIELPHLNFCVYSHDIGENNLLQEITNSFSEQRQNYRNIQHFFSSQRPIDDFDLFNEPPFLKSQYVPLQNNQQAQSLSKFKAILIEKCPEKSIVLLCRSPIKNNVFHTLNLLYQLQNIWLTYYIQPGSIENPGLNSINSFYIKLLTNIPLNAQKMNQNFENLAASFLKLSKYRAETFPVYFLYQQLPNVNGLECFRGVVSEKNALVETTLMYLQPTRDSQRDVLKGLRTIKSQKSLKPKFNERNLIKLPQMLEAIEYLGIKSLPDDHFLALREINRYESKYSLSQYQMQKPICLIIPSRNNIPDNRYKKVLDTVRMQNYSNYHIVFIDDFSTDNTFEMTESYLKQLGLLQKTKMVKNDHQMFATFNIQNAIHNHCSSGEIAVLLDGDDQLIGKQVFKLINAAYSKTNIYQQKNWIVYFTFIGNNYMYGVSKQLNQNMFSQSPERERIHVIGALRTFYVDLYRKIQMKDHKTPDGQFFDTLYDDAMQFPLMEMSGIEHMEYVPEIVYLYNLNYGNNDGSTPQGAQDRQKHLLEVLKRPKYKKLEKLFEQ